jgi:hypothetical protein
MKLILFQGKAYDFKGWIAATAGLKNYRIIDIILTMEAEI